MTMGLFNWVDFGTSATVFPLQVANFVKRMNEGNWSINGIESMSKWGRVMLKFNENATPHVSSFYGGAWLEGGRWMERGSKAASLGRTMNNPDTYPFKDFPLMKHGTVDGFPEVWLLVGSDRSDREGTAGLTFAYWPEEEWWVMMKPHFAGLVASYIQDNPNKIKPPNLETFKVWVKALKKRSEYDWEEV